MSTDGDMMSVVGALVTQARARRRDQGRPLPECIAGCPDADVHQSTAGTGNHHVIRLRHEGRGDGPLPTGLCAVEAGEEQVHQVLTERSAKAVQATTRPERVTWPEPARSSYHRCLVHTASAFRVLTMKA